jgi:predicted transcriptional regulator
MVKISSQGNKIGHKRGVMHNIPDLRVWRTANEYQEVASLCNDHRKIWVGAVNAALAIEIYLKSFLSEEVLIPIDGGISQSFKETERGHDLLTLYEKIPTDLQNELCRQYALINSNSPLPKLLDKHKDTFLHARYVYEKNDKLKKSIGNDIIFLAEELREVVLHVAEAVHPKIKAITLK